MELKNNQQGNTLSIVLIAVSLLLLGSLIFGFWAFSGEQKYKNNTQAISDQAVSQAVQATQQQDTAKYNEQLKNPYRNYVAPAQYGALKVVYPNTWSAYVDDSGSGQALVDGYFKPGIVPSISSQGSIFALRVQVVSQAYSQLLTNFNSLSKGNKATITPYVLPKVPSVTGIKIVGVIGSNGGTQTGSMVVLPLRGYTIEIYTMGSDYQNDFNNIILPNLTFSP